MQALSERLALAWREVTPRRCALSSRPDFAAADSWPHAWPSMAAVPSSVTATALAVSTGASCSARMAVPRPATTLQEDFT